MGKEYTLGLDIGTDSVGWAVVDENRNLVKKHGKTLWGVRMFDASKSASERRIYRCNRRRLKRRRERLDLLEEIFKDEINKVDPKFFIKLNESFYKKEDRTIDNLDLFTNYMTNSEYYKKYHTIWHLRNKLIHNPDKKFDIRLIYLAIHHIIKYRGNFLIDGDFKKEDYNIVIDKFKKLNEAIRDTREFFENEDCYDSEIYSSYFKDIEFDDKLIEKIINVLKDDYLIDENNQEIPNYSKTYKKTNLKKALNASSKDIYSELIINLLVSHEKNKLNTLAPIKNLGYLDHGINLYSETFEEDIDVISTYYPEFKNIFDCLPGIKVITDYIQVLDLLGDDNYLSDAFLRKYKTHKQELLELKKLVKKYLTPKEYDEIFRDFSNEKISNYPRYVGMNKSEDNKEINHFKHAKYEDFIKFLKPYIEKIKNVASEEDNVLIEAINKKIDNNKYLLKLNSSYNGSIPHQLHEQELKIILNNQAKFYPFLNELDLEANLTNKDKIIKIFTFKRPYYVGPLKGDGTYNWAKFKEENQKIYPWNFDKVVDLDESAKVFISRMQNKCTYLKGEHDFCLPKESIMYQEYMVLNYLNGLSINGNRIDKYLKDELYEELFKKRNKVTSKNIQEFILNRYSNEVNKETLSIPECNVSLSSYVKFKELFEEEYELNKEKIEDIIKDITIFEDKSILERRLREIYKLDDEKVKTIKSFNFKKYGRLSKTFLSKLEIISEDGIYKGVLPILKETTLTLNEILFSEKYKVNQIIDEYNKKNVKKFDDSEALLEFLDENITLSPIYIRPLIQTIRIIDELENQILHQKISYYSVEVTREKENNRKQKDSRYEQIKALLKESGDLSKAIKENARFNVDLKRLNQELERAESRNAVSLSDKIYFYFTQLGKDMYTLEDIDFEDVLNTKNPKYDIDHIYPQSLVKDDSISNRVLTAKYANHSKSDKFLCEMGYIHDEHRSFFKILLDNKLITKTKYNRLTERNVDDAKLESFAAQQKVATDQAVKAVITTLKLFKGVPEQNIIYSKASHISDFRRDYDLLKSRTANNYHHAHDAYMNAVIGKMLDDYFNDRFWLTSYISQKHSNDRKKYTTNFMTIIKSKRTKLNNPEEVIWNGEEDINKIIKNVRERFDILETTRTYNGNSMFNKVTVLPKGQGTTKVKNLTPNGNAYDIASYGGITSPSYSKFVVIEEETKKGKVSKLIAIPRNYDSRGMKNESELPKENNYISEVLGIKSYKVVHPNIKINVVIEQEKRKSYITGVTGDRFVLKNAIDRNFTYESIKTIHHIDKYLDLIASKNNKKIDHSDPNKIVLHLSKKILKFTD